MTDIEKLIERLRDKAFQFSADPILEEAADALTRLVAPLPAEVEEAIVTLGIYAGPGGPTARRLLESLARENARLAAENAELRREIHHLKETRITLEAHGRMVDETKIDNARLRAELETAKPLLEAAVAFQRCVDGIGQIVGHPDRRLRDAAKEYGRRVAPLDAKKGGAT